MRTQAVLAVREIVAASGAVALATGFANQSGCYFHVAVDAAGNVYVADAGKN